MQPWKQIVEAVRQVQTRKGRLTFGRYSIEGTRHIERALRANLPLQQILIAESFWHSTAARHQALRSAIESQAHPVVLAPDEVLETLLGGRKLGAIVALATLPTSPTLASLVANHRDALFLVLVDVVEPGNVGAMIRSAHGLGATACITIGKSDPFHPKAVRTAMGSSFKLPIIQFESERDAVDALKAVNCVLYASVAEDGQLLPEATVSQGVRAILMGGEFYGLSAETIAQCNYRLTIPMATGIDSFSVSAAAAILLYAARAEVETPII
ncbi:MAG: TrmH family RNA methyltransferase [Candidatus Promineifilaceae bacterium]